MDRNEWQTIWYPSIMSVSSCIRRRQPGDCLTCLNFASMSLHCITESNFSIFKGNYRTLRLYLLWWSVFSLSPWNDWKFVRVSWRYLNFPLFFVGFGGWWFHTEYTTVSCRVVAKIFLCIAFMEPNSYW